MLCNNIITRFILIEPHHPGNVGAAARALKTMGFNDLVLVSPRDPKVLNRVKTKEGASGATDVLSKAKVYSNLLEASDGIEIFLGTGMPHDMSIERKERHYYAPRKYFENMLRDGQSKKKDAVFQKSNQNELENDILTLDFKRQGVLRVAFIFGNERVGMKEEDMDRCDAILGIPTNPDFGSLNLASAVQLIAYDWREAIGGY